MTINVGIDFDEPVYPWYDLAHKASLKAGIALPHHEPTSWAPFNHYGCTLEEWVAVLDNEILNGDMYHQPFKPGVVDAIRRLYTRGYNIHIITARGQFGEMGELVKKITKSQIIKQGLPYTTLTFAKDKVPVALDLELDYMLDDAPHNVDPLLDAGINTFLLDERWNQDHPATFYDEYRRVDPAPGTRGRRVRLTQEFCNMILDKHFTPAALTDEQRRHVREPLSTYYQVRG